MSAHLTLAIVAVFTSVALATGLVASRVLALRSPVRRRFRQLFQPVPDPVPAASLLADPPNARVQRLSKWVPSWPSRIGGVALRLEALGYRGTSAMVVFTAIEIGLGVAA